MHDGIYYESRWTYVICPYNIMKKRSVERIPSNLDAEFIWSERVNSGSLADISENGMLINTSTCPPMRAKFEVSIPVGDEILKVPVKVRRVTKKDNVYDSVGLEVLNPPRKYLEFISELRWKQIKGIATNGQIVKLYVCRMCNHISFDHAPLVCPICNSTIESFEKAPDAIKRPDNFAELSEFEKKHIPSIRISRQQEIIDAFITVGEIEHSMDLEHHISFIDCYYNSSQIKRECISRVNFSCERMCPSTTLRFHRVHDGVLTVISNCNAHGNWLAKATI